MTITRSGAEALPDSEQAAFAPPGIRRLILEMAYRGQTAHIACAFSIVEILVTIYSRFLRFSKTNPYATDRDLLVLSKGHGVMALYACLHQVGWIKRSQIEGYFGDGSQLRGLCEVDVPGCEVTSGSLGHGLPIAAGMAYGVRRRGTGQRVYCVVGDGEMNEGAMWEAILFAAHHRLHNLTVVVDANGCQAMGRTSDILEMEPFVEKFRAFGCTAVECDGHDVAALAGAISLVSQDGAAPGVVVARTVKGYGVSFIANDNAWHYTRLTDELYEKARAELL